MKRFIRTQASATSLIAIGMGISNTSASAALASYYIGVDSRPTMISGTYLGLSNPNAGRLTALFAHYDENDPLYPHHYHSKGTYVYTGPNLGAATPVIVSTSNFLPEASGGTHLKLSASTAGPYLGKTAILEDPDNHFTLLRMYDTGKLDTAIPLENTLFTSSADRWSSSIAGANVNMVLTFATPGLNFGTSSDPNANPFAGNVKVLGDDVNFKWVPWVDSSTAENTPFIARFKLVDDRSGPNKFGDSGEFEFRFQTIPEPSSALLALLGGLFLFRRQR